MKNILKSILLIVLFVGLANNAWATHYSNLQTTDWINFRLQCLDTVAGRPFYPDSVHVLVWYGNSPNASLYSNRAGTNPANAVDWIDSMNYAGAWQIWFRDQIADIDGDSGMGLYSGTVKCFKNKYPTYNDFSFYKITNSFNHTLAQADTNLNVKSSTLLTKTVFDDSIDGKATFGQASAIQTKTDKLTFNAQDSLIIDYSNIPYWAQPDSFTLDRSNAWGLGVQANLIAGDSTMIMDEIKNFDAWNPITDQESLVVDQSTMRWDLTSAGVTDTALIKTMIRRNWDVDADGEWDTVEFVKAGNITASCEGTGANTLTIRIRNSADSTALAGFNVVINDSATGGWQRSGTTNSSGNVVFGVEDGSYVTYLWAPRWSIISPRYLNVTTNMDSTFYATLFTPSPPPPGDSICIVYGYVYHADDTPYHNARVRIWMGNTGVSYHGTFIDVKTPAIAYTDTLGYFEFSATKSTVEGIYPNAVLWWKGVNTTKWWIEVVGTNMSKIDEFWFTVPVAGSCDVGDIYE